MLNQLTHQDFTQQMGKAFKLTLPDQSQIDLTLVDVAELPPPVRRRKPLPENLRRTPFAVYFTCPPLLQQGTYPIQQEMFGEAPVEIFIVPIGKADDGYEYEAIFT